MDVLPLNTLPDRFDENNPHSLVNLVPPELQVRLKNISPHVFELSEDELLKHIGKSYTGKSKVVSCLRMAFWYEYDMAQADLRAMRLEHILNRVATKENFRKLCENDYFVALLVTPPISYEVLTQEALLHGITKIREILDLPLLKDDGSPNAAMIDKVLRATMFLDLRVRGGITQKHEIKQMNLNVGSAQKLGADMRDMSLDEIERRIESIREKKRNLELEKKIEAGEHVPDSIYHKKVEVLPRE